MSKINIGKILTSHGIKGNVKLESYAENPKDIFNYELFDGEDKQYKVKFVGTLNNNAFIAEIEGFTSLEVAKEYRNTLLWTEMESDENEIYIEDMLKANVKSNDGKSNGKILSIEDYGAGNVVEIQWNGEQYVESLPLIDEYFEEITKDLIVVKRPEYV
ncbi:MAG: ribosome maturation factor RimM [Rickettsiales bacterium]|jgi:16S rRNA processing protein RimM|nr:ribosome maturation factor RimM [Rickettsiales bacterium]